MKHLLRTDIQVNDVREIVNTFFLGNSEREPTLFDAEVLEAVAARIRMRVHAPLYEICGAKKDNFTCQRMPKHKGEHRDIHPSGGSVGWDWKRK